MATKNTRLTAITLVVTLIIMVIIVVVMVARGNLVRTEGGPQTAHDADMVVATTSMSEVTKPRANGTLHGSNRLNEDCAVQLVFTNDTADDIVISLYVETTTSSDEHEEMVPAGGSFTVTLIRAEPVTLVSAVEASGNSGYLVNWAPDYSDCPNGPAFTPPTGGVGDSQQIERPAPSADLGSDLNAA